MTSAAASPISADTALDDPSTICAIGLIACMLSTLVHEGLGHTLTAVVTLHASGTLTSLAWVSAENSRVVLAAGTLANLLAALVFWLLLRWTRGARPSVRFFFLIAMAFNLLSGAGYFFYSGAAGFGDWAEVIAGLPPHALLRAALVLVGVVSYYGAIVLVGSIVVRCFGVDRSDGRRFRRLLWLPYCSAIAIAFISGARNPIGWQYVFLSAMAGTAGGNCGLLWLRYYIPKRVRPGPDALAVRRSYAWIAGAAVLAAAYIVVLGPGVHIHG